MNMQALDDDALMLARGKYSTLNAARKDSLNELRTECEAMQRTANDAMKYAQGDMTIMPSDISEHYKEIIRLADYVREIDAQRAELKNIAWPK